MDCHLSDFARGTPLSRIVVRCAWKTKLGHWRLVVEERLLGSIGAGQCQSACSRLIRASEAFALSWQPSCAHTAMSSPRRRSGAPATWSASRSVRLGFPIPFSGIQRAVLLASSSVGEVFRSHWRFISAANPCVLHTFARRQESDAFSEFTSFIEALGDSVKGLKISDECLVSEVRSSRGAPAASWRPRSLCKEFPLLAFCSHLLEDLTLRTRVLKLTALLPAPYTTYHRRARKCSTYWSNWTDG